MKAYITASSAITAQNTFYKEEYLKAWVPSNEPYRAALEPDYKNIIDPKLSRRMSRIIKMSIASGAKVLADAGVNQPGAIVVGTGLGCIKDTEKFLKDLIEANEGLLSPTAFIQSTHNTIAGQIALLLQCPEDNFTYVNRGHSFENALTDAMLRVNEGTEHVLLGGADEMTLDVHDLLVKMGCEKDIPTGEGACFFLVSDSKTDGAVGIEDLYTFNNPQPKQLPDLLEAFLNKNSRRHDEIDALILGTSGASEDLYYKQLMEAFSGDIPVAGFKHVTGEYFTASAYAYNLGFTMLQEQQVYSKTLLSGDIKRSLRRVLIYNHYKGVTHSMALLSL